RLKADYQYFGYGYLDSPQEAVPPVALTFYSFRIMVMGGGYLLALMAVVLLMIYWRPELLDKRWMCWISMLSIPVVWIVSECGWITAEVGRQPWIIEGIMPCKAAISHISSMTVMTTFWLFALVFTAFLAAEMTIMCRQISQHSLKSDND
ncbi:MAG: cytochrome ubiquinol oxidase subunit I, partial [Muribaculum sp.]|nr:cytochrome ubiquinol oxidase subunit I [Muribaculum sp.]